jgi:hypothetical protein
MEINLEVKAKIKVWAINYHLDVKLKNSEAQKRKRRKMKKEYKKRFDIDSEAGNIC